MNPSFPSSTGDRHPSSQPPSLSASNSGGLNKSGQSTHHPFHSQPLTQLTHPGQHGSSLHPIHGGTHSGSMLHSGPPPLPGPPLTSSLSSSNTTRSPHHQLPSSILHPRSGPLSQGGPSSLGKSTGGPGGLSSGGVSSSFPGRMSSQPSNTGPEPSSSVPSLKPGPSFSIRPRPSSPRRTHEVGMSSAQPNQQSQQGTKAQYGMERPTESEKDTYYHNQPVAKPQSAARTRELRVEDALLYLDQVKQQFGDQPDIYNQFLDVMKDFKAQAIDTPGVIVRVSNLFRGYPNLILGFNTFLPPGYRIRPDTTVEVIPSQGGTVAGGANAGRQGGAQAMYPGGQVSTKPSSSSQRQPLAPAQAPKQTQPKQSSKKSSNQAAPRSTTNPVEFDHAIHYVTKIKLRFQDEPETYKAFLEILHTYQKEQRSIRQVLDQVSYLFRDHPDLLREFTFFLPDAVQEQAKERLNRAAEKAQLRKDIMSSLGSRSNQEGAYDADQMQGYERGTELKSRSGRAGHPEEDEYYRRTGRDDLVSPRSKVDAKTLERREKERERERNKALFAHKRSKRRSYDGRERRDFLAVSDVVVETEEWGIFERIKKILPSRDSWREFLKCLELYSQEVLGRSEMLSLMKNLFGRHTELVEEFDKLLCSHGQQQDEKEIWPFIPLAETDLSQCRRATPSYRALPSSYPIPPCSFRSKLEKSVCNDVWVSVPTGSEDFSFKNMRKNQYEEALFKCEDERFEIDMVIDANASTISILEPLAKEIETLKESTNNEEKLWNYTVDKGTFRVTHLNAITRIYGDAGTQILDLLRKYPAGAIPVILKRLKQKDEEWRRAREDLNKQWKEVNEKNYHKSLDHSSFYFKQKDKKETSMKVLLQEAKKKMEAAKEAQKNEETNEPKGPPKAQEIANALEKEQSSKEKQQEAEETKEKKKEDKPSQEEEEAAKATSATKQDTAASTEWMPHFTFNFGSVQIHKDAYSVLCYAAEKNLSASEKEKVSRVWKSFYFPFFHLNEEWLLRKPKRTAGSFEKAKTLRAGTEVATDFGDGTVQYFDREKRALVVNLPIAQAFLQPDAISIQEAVDFPPELEVSDDLQGAMLGKLGKKSVYYGSQHAYAFVRLYQMLHHRLEKAYELCEKAKRNRYRRTINPAARALQHSRHTNSDGTEKPGDYQAYLSNLYALIDGSEDATKYEDTCRSLMGSTSYFLFTMDKLVSSVLRQMQQLGGDDTCQELMKTFKEQNDPLAGPIDKEAYLNKTKSLFEGEGAFHIEFRPGVVRRSFDPSRVVPTTPKTSTTNFDHGKIWAPSPRVRQYEQSKWLVEPELSIEYLGSMDEDAEDDDDDGDESPTATPPETPIATPLAGSPVRGEPQVKKVKKEPAEESGFSAEDDDKKVTSKKRSRSNSQEAPVVQDSKKVKQEEDANEAAKGERDEDEDMEDAGMTASSQEDVLTGDDEDEEDGEVSVGKSTASASASGDEGLEEGEE